MDKYELQIADVIHHIITSWNAMEYENQVMWIGWILETSVITKKVFDKCYKHILLNMLDSRAVNEAIYQRKDFETNYDKIKDDLVSYLARSS